MIYVNFHNTKLPYILFLSIKKQQQKNPHGWERSGPILE